MSKTNRKYRSRSSLIPKFSEKISLWIIIVIMTLKIMKQFEVYMKSFI